MQKNIAASARTTTAAATEMPATAPVESDKEPEDTDVGVALAAAWPALGEGVPLLLTVEESPTSSMPSMEVYWM